jgi:NmrA-like family
MGCITMFGATGLIGSPIAEEALRQGHECRVVSRAKTSKNAEVLDHLESLGAQLFLGSPEDQAWIESVLRGSDAVICTMGEAGVYGHVEDCILKAALVAGIKRFIPNEFGLDTLRLPPGTGALFDEKQEFQRVLKESGMPFTILFNGGIFDYFLPNLRMSDAITTYGNNFDVPYYTHSRADLAAITIRAVFDAKSENQYIHLKHNLVTQRQVLKKLDLYYPDNDFPREHVTQKEILDGTHEVKAAIWIDGHAGKTDPRCIDAARLFADYAFESVDHALQNRAFVFEKG